MTELTVERLRELFSSDADTGTLTRIASRGNVRAGTVAGTLESNGYLQLMIDGKTFMVHRLVWFYHYGRWPTHHLDHINGVCTDNRIVNLREATGSQNSCNRRIHSNNKSGFKGVSLRKDMGLWRAMIMLNGKSQHLGYFDTPEEAHAAYTASAVKYHGEFARTA